MQPSQTTSELSKLYTQFNGTNIKSGGNDIRSIGISHKTIGGRVTDIPSIVFHVKSKKPLSELEKNKIIPKKVTINGIEYLTDVVEQKSQYRTLNCLNDDGCYANDVNTYAQDHRKKFRWYPSQCDGNDVITPGSGNPIQGGISIGQQDAGIGTLGCIVQDNVNGKFCALSNSHVLVEDAFLASEKNLLTGRPFTISNIKGKGVTQPGEIFIGGGLGMPRFNSDYGIGFVKRYVPLYLWNWNGENEFIYFNYADAAICSLIQQTTEVSTIASGDSVPNPSKMPFVLWTDSTKQFNMKFYNTNTNQYDIEPTEYPFATAEEIDALPIKSSNQSGARVWKSGRTTGFVGKGICNSTYNPEDPNSTPEDPNFCQLELLAKNETVQVYGYKFSQYTVNVIFSDCLKFAYKQVDGETKPRPGGIQGGDSGSVLIADIGGTKKIIGLNFAGDGTYGFANRIHYLTDSDGLNVSSTSTADGMTFQECNYDNPYYSGYYDDPSTWKFRIEQGLSPNKKISVGLNDIYYQCGLFK